MQLGLGLGLGLILRASMAFKSHFLRRDKEVGDPTTCILYSRY